MSGGSLLAIQEYVAAADVLTEASMRSGSSPEALTSQLLLAGEKVAANLGFSSNPIRVIGTQVKATDFAGMIRVGGGVELEIVPKFLDANNPSWREDFFFLSMISRHGYILHRERLGAVTTASSDIATLVAQCLAAMFLQHSRRPIRSYRKHFETDFMFEGEVDEVDLLLPDSSGFNQSVVRYSRDNSFNRLLLESARSVLPLVREDVTRRSVERMISVLGRQDSRLPQRGRRLPSRARHWQSTIELARDILDGLGVSFGVGSTYAPGFVIDTWRMWEDLLEIGFRALPSEFLIHPQKGATLGTRQQFSSPHWHAPRPFGVVPDFHVEGTGLAGPILLDAKYKGRFADTSRRVSEADIYEALAFSKASGIPRVLLLYPRSGSFPASTVGSHALFEKVTVGGTQVWAADVEVRGISSAGALARFADNLRKCLILVSSEMLAGASAPTFATA